jgi:hypothetical protein
MGYNTHMNFKERACEDMNWINLSQDTSRFEALGNKVMNFRVPYKFMNYFTGLETIPFLRRVLPSEQLVSGNRTFKPSHSLRFHLLI